MLYEKRRLRLTTVVTRNDGSPTKYRVCPLKSAHPRPATYPESGAHLESIAYLEPIVYRRNMEDWKAVLCNAVLLPRRRVFSWFPCVVASGLAFAWCCDTEANRAPSLHEMQILCSDGMQRHITSGASVRKFLENLTDGPPKAWKTTIPATVSQKKGRFLDWRSRIRPQNDRQLQIRVRTRPGTDWSLTYILGRWFHRHRRLQVSRNDDFISRCRE